MADRVSASIVVGGALTTSDYLELAAIIAGEGLSIEWDGEPFAAHHRIVGESLNLYAHEVAWGRFEELETWCVEHKLAFSRWSGGYGSEWTAERVVFTGEGEPKFYTADEDDRIMIDRSTVERLVTIEAMFAYFDAADAAVPPLVVDGVAGKASPLPPETPLERDRL